MVEETNVIGSTIVEPALLDVTFTEALAQFHLLRPWWLIAIIVAIPLLWWVGNSARLGNWSKVIDPRWLPFMLESGSYRRRKQWPWLMAIIIAALALSGPSWQQLPQPLHKDQSALVILLDLSPSMTSTDVTPNRITSARYKLQDILQQRREGQTALVVYSGSAHIVVPLTDDTTTISSQLSVLKPGLITQQGSNTEAAMELAIQMFTNNGYKDGDILLITDGVANQATKTIRKQLKGTALRLSILGVGTDKGAPITLPDGSFAKDNNGNIVMPKLERGPLLKLAQRNGGQYTDLTPGDSDLQLLAKVFATPQAQQTQQSKKLERTFDSWHDQGYWFVLLVIPFVVLAFRKGLIACLLLMPALGSLTIVEPAQAAEPAQAVESQASVKQTPKPIIDNLPKFLQTKDQQGQRAFQNQQFEQASDTFEDSRWKGSAAYRNGDFETALLEFQKDNSAPGLYNQGNALAQLGELDKAIEAYTSALEKDPSQTDAAANKKLLEELKKQQQQNNQQQDEKQDGDKQKSQDQQNSQQDSQEKDSQQSSEQDSQQQQQSDQQGSDQKDSDQESSEQQSSDEQKNDQQDAKDKAEQQASEKDGNEQQDSEAKTAESSDPAEEEAKQAMEQYLRKVPDNPGAFLKEKFRRQQRQQQRNKPEQPKRW